MKPKAKQTPQEFIKSLLPLIYLILALLALRYWIVEPYVVPTGSMEPTLKTGDRLYALKCAYNVSIPFTDWVLFRTGKIKRGDVILFTAPPGASREGEITFVKRAIGLPGDRIKFENGILYVNGEEAVKSVFPSREVMYDIEDEASKTLYLEKLSGVLHYVILNNADPRMRDVPEQVVPEGYFFAVGDNRDNSSDSRYWGFAPIDNLKGRAMFIWFSSWDWRVRPERIGTLIR